MVWRCGLSANLGCRSETCCTRLAENTGRKKSPKIRHLSTIAQLCRAISSQPKHVGLSTIGKKLVKQQNLPTCPYNNSASSPQSTFFSGEVFGELVYFLSPEAVMLRYQCACVCVCVCVRARAGVVCKRAVGFVATVHRCSGLVVTFQG